MSLDPAGALETSLWDRIEAFHSSSAEPAGKGDVAGVAERALEVALELTRASVAFIGLVDDAGKQRQIFSRSADPTQAMPRDEIDSMFTGAANGDRPAPAADSDRSVTSFRGQPLRAGGRTIGMIGVAGVAGFTASQRRSFVAFANMVASALEIATLQQRRQEMVDALVNLRENLDRSERQRLLSEERVQSAIRLEKAHELAVEALLAVSVHAGSGSDFSEFYRDLTEAVARLVGAKKVLFWQLNPDRTLTAIPGGHGIDEAFLARLYPAPAEPYGTDLTSQVVYHDLIFRAARSAAAPSQLDDHVLDVLGVSSAISVPWRAGHQRLGVVAAYDSDRADGFTMEDAWVLRMAGLAAGLVWQLKLAESDLTRTIFRLQKVDEARQLLLKNMSTAVDKARKRFASDLHDDALQKLTAAELQLQRVPEGRATRRIQPIRKARELLVQAEEGLRKLMFEVQPPALESPGGFELTIRDRAALLRSLTGLEAKLDLELPDDPPYEIKSVVFRQVAEALTNIEKHAAASEVTVTVKPRDGGIHGVVSDDGSGFVVAERDHLPGHLGLLALKERALLAGGWCEIRSTPGSGTEVEFWIPTVQ